MAITMAEANRRLRQLPEDLAADVQQVSGVTAFNIARAAAADVPLGPGRDGIHLRTAIGWAYSGKVAATVRVPKGAFYWKFLEYGTIKRSALAMFRRAGEANRADHGSRLMQVLERATGRLDQGGGTGNTGTL